MIMDTDQGRVTLDTVHRPTAPMVTDQGAVTVMDMDQGRVTTDTAHRPALSHRPARTMDTAHRPVTAMETAQDLATIMDGDQPRVGMDMDHRPVTGAPLERQPIRQTVMRLSRSSYRTCPRLLLVNNDRRARALALSTILASARPASLLRATPQIKPS
jgi:hypothetical protein